MYERNQKLYLGKDINGQSIINEVDGEVCRLNVQLLNINGIYSRTYYINWRFNYLTRLDDTFLQLAATQFALLSNYKLIYTHFIYQLTETKDKWTRYYF